MRQTLAAVLCAFPLLFTLPACSKAYYSTMEVFGREKRDILASRVKSAQEGQQEAKQQFQSALDRFSTIVKSGDTDLRKAYDKAKADLDRSQAKADAVHDKVASVESVGKDLFKEWEDELREYKSDELRNRSKGQLQDTRRRYDQMLAAMKKAEASMDPVLDTFSDTVLMLKHTHNAETVAALKGTVSDLEREVKDLISEMERSIAESDRFINDLNRNTTPPATPTK
jgi:hypothetical protein